MSDFFFEILIFETPVKNKGFTGRRRPGICYWDVRMPNGRFGGGDVDVLYSKEDDLAMIQICNEVVVV